MAHFRWPVFLKGQRQTSRHQRSLAIIDGPEAFERAAQILRNDPILSWQQIVCREYIPLRQVEDKIPDRIPSSFEFRTFWYRGNLVGFGRYWWEGIQYAASEAERVSVIAVAKLAVNRLQIPFLVVDVAQTIDGRWIVIECNDAQESGYAGVAPMAMWQKIIDIEGARLNLSVER